MRISREALEALIQGGSKIMTLWTKTEVKLNKDGKLKYPGLMKFSRVNGVTGYNYARLLEKHQLLNGLPLEPPQPRKWGVRDGNLIRHKDRTYVSVRPIRSSVTYMLGDKEISHDEIKDYLPERQDEDIKVRDFSLDNVVAVQYGELMEVEC